MPQIKVVSNGKTEICQVGKGQTLLTALTGQGIFVDAPCGGYRKCRKCVVRATGELSPITPEELALFGCDDGRRLACFTLVEGDCTVETGSEMNFNIAMDGKSADYPLRPRVQKGCGAAVDIGTTTVVVYGYDLATGRRIGVESAVNVQRAHGADVISRITYCMQQPDGLERLRDGIREQIAGLVRKVCPDTEEISFYTIAGNTTMQHIFAGLSPEGMAAAPFTPASLFGGSSTAEACGMPGPPDCPVYILPAVAGYVGGDITAAVLSSGMDRKDELSLLVDIGTNGEMALGGRGGMVCCATAAGPAFEGADITCGMGGVPGAISTVNVSEHGLRYEVIGGGTPKGICGSGLIDAMAVMLALGAVDETGRLLPPDEAEPGVLRYVSEEDGEARFTITESVYITAGDVRRLQLAKAAVAAGVLTMLDDAGKSLSDIGTAYISGGFGSHIRIESAAAIGLYPKELLGRIVSIGNGAGMGAVAAMLSRDMEAALTEITNKCRYIELSGHAGFMDHYVECMMF